MAGAVRLPAYKRRRELWREAIFDNRTGGGEDSIASARLRLLESWKQWDGQGPWKFLSGHDVPTEADRDKVWWPNGRPIIWTVDERDDVMNIKPFPSEKEYLRHITRELWTYRVVLQDKARQMYISTLCMLNAWAFAAFNDEREIFVSRLKEESAVKLINDKIRTTHARMPKWLQDALPLSRQPQNVITCLDTRSTITGVAQNFGDGDGRGPTASLVVVDEAAFQSMFPSIYRAIMPMSARLWAVTTANIGNPGAALFKDLAHEGRPGVEQEEDTDD